MIRNICFLEGQALQNQTGRDHRKIRETPLGVVDILKRITKRIDIERIKRDDPKIQHDETIPKLKKQMHVARRQQIIDAFNAMKEQICMSIEDDTERFRSFLFNRNDLNASPIVRLQHMDSHLASQKEKLLQRLTGFTAQIVDDFLEKDHVSEVHKRRNKESWRMQILMSELVGCAVKPPESALCIEKPDDFLSTMQKLQMVDLYFCKGVHNHAFDISEDCKSIAYKSLRKAFSALCSPSLSIADVGMLLRQSLKSLRAMMNCYDPNSVQPSGNFDEQQSEHYISSQIVHWLRIIIMVRRGEVWGQYCLEDANELGPTETPCEEFEASSQDHSAIEHFAFYSIDDLREFSRFVSCMGNPVIVDLITCSHHLLGELVNAGSAVSAQISIEDVDNFRKGFLLPSVYEHALPLIVMSIDLSAMIVRRSASWTGFEGNRIAFDIEFMEAVDDEVVAVLKATSASFAAGLILEPSINVLCDCLLVAKTRKSSYFVQMAAFQLICVATLSILQRGMTLEEVHQAEIQEVARRRVEAQRKFVAGLQEQSDERRREQIRLLGLAKVAEVSPAEAERAMEDMQRKADIYMERDYKDPDNLCPNSTLEFHAKLERSRAHAQVCPSQRAQGAQGGPAAAATEARGVSQEGGKESGAESHDALVASSTPLGAAEVVAPSGTKSVHDANVKAPPATTTVTLETPSVDLRRRLIQILTSLIPYVMEIMNIHRASLTIQHTGMVIMRMLIRELFIKRQAIEAIVAPSMDMDDDEEMEAAGKGDTSVADEQLSPLSPGQNSPVGPASPMSPQPQQGKAGGKSSGGSAIALLFSDGTDENSTLPIDEMFEKWKEKFYASHLISHEAASHPNLSLGELIIYNGETHIQSSEIIEQVLLLIHHVANQSFVCKLALLEASIMSLIEQIQILQGGGGAIEFTDEKIYLLALCDLCIESLQIEEIRY